MEDFLRFLFFLIAVFLIVADLAILAGFFSNMIFRWPPDLSLHGGPRPLLLAIYAAASLVAILAVAYLVYAYLIWPVIGLILFVIIGGIHKYLHPRSGIRIGASD